LPGGRSVDRFVEAMAPLSGRDPSPSGRIHANS
jgi:hypothetical protein